MDLSSRELLRKICNWMPTVLPSQGKYACIGYTRRISLQTQWQRRIIMTKNGCRNESINQFFKGILLGILPLISSNRAGLFTIFKTKEQGSKRFSNSGKIENKSTIEVTESKKYLNVAVGFRTRPFGNGLHAFGIHMNSFFVDNKSEIFYRGFEKFAFFGIGVQVGVIEAFDNES